jgi:tetratricopeptide (TPR) repeat protein
MIAVRLFASLPELSTNLAAIAAIKAGADQRWAIRWTWRSGGRLVLDDRVQSSTASEARPSILDPLNTIPSWVRGSMTTRGFAYADLARRDYPAYRTRVASLMAAGQQRPWESMAAAKYDEWTGAHDPALVDLRSGATIEDLLHVADRALKNGDADSARRLAGLAYEAAPGSARAAALLGHVLVVHGTSPESIQRAVDVLRAGLTAKPDDVQMRIDYAHALLNARRFDEASVELTAVAGVRPRDPVVHLLMGELLLTRGDLAGAEREYSTSFDLDNGQLWALLGLGRVYAAEGQKERAVASWRRALAIDPGFQAARDALQVSR